MRISLEKLKWPSNSRKIVKKGIIRLNSVLIYIKMAAFIMIGKSSEISDESIQIHSGLGYMKSEEVERYLRGLCEGI